MYKGDIISPGVYHFKSFGHFRWYNIDSRLRTAKAQWRTLTMRTWPLDEASAWVEKHRREWNQHFGALELHLKSMTQKEEQ